MRGPLGAVSALVLLLAVSFPSPTPLRAGQKATGPVPAQPSAWALEFTLEHAGAVSGVAFGREMIATYDADRPQPRPRLWGATDGKVLGLEVRGAYFPRIPARILRFTNDEAHLVMVNPGTILDAPSGSATRYRRIPMALVGDFIGGFDTIAFSADLSTSVNREMPRPGQPIRRDRLCLHGNPWANPNNILKPGAVLDYPGGRAITHADLCADGHLLAVTGEDLRVRIYDPASLRVLRVITLKKDSRLTAVRLSDDGGLLAAVGEAGFARVFDTATGAELCELKGHTGHVAAVTFAPDGKRVATAAGKVVRVFDARSGKPAGVIAGHADEVWAVAFSPGGNRLVTGSADRTARVWKSKP